MHIQYLAGLNDKSMHAGEGNGGPGKKKKKKKNLITNTTHKRYVHTLPAHLKLLITKE